MRCFAKAYAFAFAATLISLPTQAFDPLDAGIPEREIIGFSGDSRYFAFELYGYDEYSLDAFARISIIDTETNALVGEEPISAYVTAERLPGPPELRTARAETAEAAMSTMAELGFGDRSAFGRLLATNAPGEIVTSAEFVVFPGYPLAAEGVVLTVRDNRMPTPDHCLEVEQGYAAAEIALRRVGSETDVVIYQDESLPRHRGCPWRYTISDVMIFDPDDTG